MVNKDEYIASICPRSSVVWQTLSLEDRSQFIDVFTHSCTPCQSLLTDFRQPRKTRPQCNYPQWVSSGQKFTVVP